MKKLVLPFLFVFAVVISCESQKNSGDFPTRATLDINPEEVDTATFAGGCFWCVEAVFDRTAGVAEAVSGYSGGEASDATYDLVSRGATNHAEAVQIYFDAKKISFDELLEIFFATHDPTQLNRQGPDVGEQYRSVVFYHNREQQQKAKAYIASLNKSEKFNKTIVTQLNKLEAFYNAEDYHQDYYDHHPENPYIQSVTKPKIRKFEKEFGNKLKPQYR